jgi:hypothetical protein
MQMLRISSRLKYAWFLFRDFGGVFLVSQVVIFLAAWLMHWVRCK